MNEIFEVIIYSSIATLIVFAFMTEKVRNSRIVEKYINIICIFCIFCVINTVYGMVEWVHNSISIDISIEEVDDE